VVSVANNVVRVDAGRCRTAVGIAPFSATEGNAGYTAEHVTQRWRGVVAADLAVAIMQTIFSCWEKVSQCAVSPVALERLALLITYRLRASKDKGLHRKTGFP
jgi:hypothetical protein